MGKLRVEKVLDTRQQALAAVRWSDRPSERSERTVNEVDGVFSIRRRGAEKI